MHTFAVGGDDRDFARRFTKKYLNKINFEIWDRVYTSKDVLSAMNSTSFNICMRFHSVLFAECLGGPYLAIDYTGGGKIKGFLEDKGKSFVRIDRQDVANGKWVVTSDGILKDLPQTNHKG